MSAISNNGIAQGLFLGTQNISASDPSTEQQPSSTTSAASIAPATQDGQQTPVSGHHHHHGGGGGGGMFKKIEQAVTSALQSAQSNSSADPNQIVQDAIAKAFQADGKAQGQTQANPTGSDPDGNGDGSANGTGSASGTSSTNGFLQTLQSYGISPQQFHADLLAAVQATQAGGQVDPSAAFKNFPPGSLVDASA